MKTPEKSHEPVHEFDTAKYLQDDYKRMYKWGENKRIKPLSRYVGDITPETTNMESHRNW